MPPKNILSRWQKGFFFLKHTMFLAKTSLHLATFAEKMLFVKPIYFFLKLSKHTMSLAKTSLHLATFDLKVLFVKGFFGLKTRPFPLNLAFF